MKKLFYALLLALIPLPASCFAHEIVAGNLTIHHPWFREPRKSQDIAAGYLVVDNTGAEPDFLQSVDIEGIGKVEIHHATLENGIASMRPLSGDIEIAPSSRLTFAPGVDHLMLSFIDSNITADTYVKGQLTFRNAGKVLVEFAVEPALSTKPAKHH